ncbi:MAG: hypothetical protein JW746_10315 [Candidatus Krumholzibacteriota bacterium]|nr:hypothetical protein [Candidatus Krumholzibacteriota bacterium]
MKRVDYTLVIILILLISVSGCFEDVKEVSLDSTDTEIGIPAGLSADVSDGAVALSWVNVLGAASYNLYKKTGVAGDMKFLVNTAATSYLDEDVNNGQDYYYTVSAVSEKGLEGERTGEVQAIPSVYSIRINGGAKYTNSTDVVLSLTAPVTCVLMKISNEPDLADAEWEIFAGTSGWEIESGDAEKTVYARFQNDNGTNSPIVSKSIILDTYAAITSVEIEPDLERYGVGSTVKFSILTEDNELDGEAWIELEGYSEAIVLLDDGRGGDMAAADGSYEADFTFPSNFRGLDLGIAGRFVDKAGNSSVITEASHTLSFTDPPEAVALLAPIDSTVSSITIKWVESTEPNFLAYRIYRSTEPYVEELPEYFIRGLDSRGQTSYPDGDLTEGASYYYRIFVVNDLEETSGSNELKMSTLDDYPASVTLDPLSAIGQDRLTLTWSTNRNTDFLEYRIYRSTAPGVTDASYLVATLGVQGVGWYDDTGIDTAGNTYYYRVFVYDKGGLYSRSNEETTLE